MKSRLGLLLAGLSGFLLGGLVMYLLVERAAPTQGDVAPVVSASPTVAKQAAPLEKEPARESRQHLAAEPASPAARLVLGCTLEESGAAVPQIGLVLECPDEKVLSANSDDHGAFVFSIQKAGRFRLTAVNCPGFIPASVGVDVRPADTTVRVDLKLKRASEIPVRLLDLQGYDFWKSYSGPLALGPGAVVCTRRAITELGETSANVVGDSGLARFRALRELPQSQRAAQGDGFMGLLEPHVEPPYFVTLVCCSQVWASQEVTATPRELVFRVDAGSKPQLGSVRIRFRDARNGKLVPNLSIAVFRPGDPKATQPRVADAGGNFSFDKLPATRMLLFLANNPGTGLESFTLGFDVIANTLLDLGEFTLRTESSESRRGNVLDESGKPVAGVGVRIEHFDPNGKPSGLFHDLRTDASGAFTFDLHASGGLLHLHDPEWVCAPMRLEYSTPVEIPIEVHASRGVPLRLAAIGGVEEAWGLHLRDAQGLVAFEGTLRGGAEIERKFALGHFELTIMTPEGAVSKQPIELGAGGARVELPR